MLSFLDDSKAKLMLSELTKVVPEFAEIYVGILCRSQSRTFLV